MKQMIFLVGLILYFSVRSLADPFWAVLLYYGLAVLRPQAIWDWALNPNIRWSLIAAILAMVSVILNFGSLRHRIVHRRFIVLIVLFGLCLLGSYYHARDTGIAGRYGWEYAKVLFMLLLACFVVTERWQVRYLGWTIFIGLTYIVYEINSMYLFNHRLDIYHRGYGGFDNNGAAIMISVVIPFGFYFFQAERRWWRWFYLLCTIPAIHAVMLTYSRGAMISILVIGVGMLLGFARRRIFQAVSMGLVFFLVILVLAGPEVRNRFKSITNEADDPGSSQNLRFISWKAGYQIAMDYPIYGVGIRNSNLLTKSYGCDMEGRTIHNVYIQIAADSGILAGVIFVLLIFGTLWNLHWSARRSEKFLDDPSFRWHHYVCKAAFWSLATFSIGACFLSVETVELNYLLMLIGAVAPRLSVPESAEEPELSRTHKIPVASRGGMGKVRGLPA